MGNVNAAAPPSECPMHATAAAEKSKVEASECPVKHGEDAAASKVCTVWEEV